jgi:TPR repeat protein
MKCLLCAALKRFGVNIKAPCSATNETIQKQRSSWERQQTNTRELWKRDTEQWPVKEAVRLNKSDPSAGLTRLLELAENGSVWSMLYVGWAYHTGTGVATDLTRAEHWYRKASEGGAEEAILTLGAILWARGDLIKAEDTYALGAARNFAPAIYWLAKAILRQSHTRETLTQACTLLEQASARGHLWAQRDLSYYLTRGRLGLRQIPRGIRLSIDACTKMAALLEQDQTSHKHAPRASSGVEALT